jgi:transcriptional regulator with XRE-family HTH domain
LGLVEYLRWHNYQHFAYRLDGDELMARITDHPVRLARIAAGLSQNKLAERAGIHRSALTAIEDGRTKRPTPALVGTLATILGTSPAVLNEEIDTWLNRPLAPSLKPSAKNLMEIPPYVLGQYYSTFEQWRKEIAPTVTAFASMLRINPAIVRDYESGKYKSMPDGLSGKMMNAFGIDGEYLVALEGLPRG